SRAARPAGGAAHHPAGPAGAARRARGPHPTRGAGARAARWVGVRTIGAHRRILAPPGRLRPRGASARGDRPGEPELCAQGGLAATALREPGAATAVLTVHWRAWPVHLTAAVLVAVILGPLAQAGYVLSYDMVFVPRQHLSWHLIAPAD